ncbi:hypothetical protein MBLNU230_g1160t1 [Neophaeotheca triangularis]
MNRSRDTPNARPRAGRQSRGTASQPGTNRGNAFQALSGTTDSSPTPSIRGSARGSHRGSAHHSTPPPKAPTGPSSSKESSQDRSWNIVEAPRNRRRPPPKFDLRHEDNAGEVAWRQRQHPVAVIRIPEDLVIALTEYYDIAQRYHVFLLREQVKSDKGSIPFAMWGEPDAVDAAKTAIESWVEQHARSKAASGASSHPKIASLTPRLREIEARYWDRELKQQRYRQNPPVDQEFEVIGAFHWPIQEYRPDEVLGSSFEAFDPIRTDSSCYIIFNKERAIFQVYGVEDNVKAALARIRRTCFQVTAQQLPTVYSYLLRWSQDQAFFPRGVVLESYYRPTTIPPPTTGTSEPSYMPKAVGAGVPQEMGLTPAQSAEADVESARMQVMETLRKLQFYRGNIQMRVRLGTFLLVQYRKTENGMYQFPEYESMIKQSRFSGKTTQEIGDWEVEANSLARLQTANDLLTPLNAMVDKLEDSDRTFTAVFTFHDEAGIFRLTMVWIKTPSPHSDSSSYDTVSRKWCKLDRDLKNPLSLLDISLTDLTTSSAIHIDISSTTTVNESRVPPHLTRFATMVKFNRPAAEAITKSKSQIPPAQDNAFTSFSPAPSLRSLEQRIPFQYGLKDFDATVELTRFQHRAYAPRSFAPESDQTCTVFEPRWALELRREAWDTMFGQNERLGVGEGTGWSFFEEAWFPLSVRGTEMGSGFGQLVERIGRLEGVLRGGLGDDGGDARIRV